MLGKEDSRFLEECPAERILRIVRGACEWEVIDAAIGGKRVLGHKVEGGIREGYVDFARVSRIFKSKCYTRIVGLKLIMQCVVDEVSLSIVVEYESESGFKLLTDRQREEDPGDSRVQVGRDRRRHEGRVCPVLSVFNGGDVHAQISGISIVEVESHIVLYEAR